METSDVRRRVMETVERARRGAAARRARNDEATREYSVFLERVAVPLMRQIAGALKAENYHFTVFTPAGSVRLASDRSADDYIEVSLDTTGEAPAVLGQSRRARGHRIIESERPIGAGPIRDVTEDEVLSFVVAELEPLLER